MARHEILLIEDDHSVQELISYNLQQEGWGVTICADGAAAAQRARTQDFALILLDLMLPGADGLRVCREIKLQRPAVPVIMVTAKGEETDIILGLEMGADDYITKPFSPKILVARIKAVLRRQNAGEAAAADKLLKRGALQIDQALHQVKFQTKPIDLTAVEFKLLTCLARRPGWVFTRNQIIDAVRGADAVIADRAVDVQIVGLRRKLGAASKLIETVRGVGYRFRDEEG